jgi:hypothetical protein
MRKIPSPQPKSDQKYKAAQPETTCHGSETLGLTLADHLVPPMPFHAELSINKNIQSNGPFYTQTILSLEIRLHSHLKLPNGSHWNKEQKSGQEVRMK